MTKIEHDGVAFFIDERKETLVKMCCAKTYADVFIPHEFPNGQKITVLGNRFCLRCNGVYGTIPIDDRIKNVYPNAFENASVVKVVWPSSCHIIPEKCFFGSNIRGITNIEHVETIETGAFSNSCILEINWPTKCHKIPKYCFSNSDIKKITNIENVTNIEKGAFTLTAIEEFTWPSGCHVIPTDCFLGSSLRTLKNISEVTSIWPGAFQSTKIEHFTVPKGVTGIGASAFRECSALKSIDLNDDIIHIGTAAFASTSIGSVRWPASCNKIPLGCFMCSEIRRISNLDNVVEIESKAFAGAKLKKIDLSSSHIEIIAEDAFEGLDVDMTMPYYCNAIA